MGARYTYRFTIYFIHLWKGLELWLMKLIPSVIERIVKASFAKGGITVNGNQPWDIKEVNKDKDFYLTIANKGNITGVADTYMDGLWECEDIVELFRRLGRFECPRIYLNPWNRFLNYMECMYFNLQDKEGAGDVVVKHYDIGNDVFESLLDPNMLYSCGYWRTAKNLDEAQYDKLELIAKKLNLKPGMRVLDLGCGYGALSLHLAKNYGVSCIGISNSKEQLALAKDRCDREGPLPVELRLMDYRDIVDEQFDRIAAIEMLEHVGPHNYNEFFKLVHRCLKDDGIFICQCSGVNHYDVPCSEPWIQKYIFPNGVLPYYKQITDAIEKRFVIEDWQNFGYDYSKTLVAWHENFRKNWPKIEHKYGYGHGPRVFRMWTIYLLATAGLFESRKLQLWQIVLSKDGIEGSYYATR